MTIYYDNFRTLKNLNINLKSRTMKNYASSLIAIFVIFAITILLDLWLFHERTALHFYFWAGFITFLIISGNVINNLSPEAQLRTQKFLTLCSIITSLMFLGFSLSFLEVFNETWLTTLRWPLIIATSILYGLLVIEISESPENIKRIIAKKIEWRYLINNTLIIVAILVLFLQWIIFGFKLNDSLINYYFIGFILFMALGYFAVYYAPPKIKSFSAGGLVAIFLALIVLAIICCFDNAITEMIANWGAKLQTMKILTFTSAGLLFIALLCRIAPVDSEKYYPD